nr:MAG TPA: hypothetical protein [Caudoviricetes sp.]
MIPFDSMYSETCFAQVFTIVTSFPTAFIR